MMQGGTLPPIPMASHAATGFGPPMITAPVEIRHAPLHQRPENAELREEDKVVAKRLVKDYTHGGETAHTASGTDEFVLYGALDDLRRKELSDQAEKLTRRRRVNCVPAMLSLFLPWVLFLVVYSVQSFYFHYVFPAMCFFFNSFVLLCVVAYAWGAWQKAALGLHRDFYPAYFSVAFLTAVTLGWLLGDLNFWYNMQPCYNIEHLASYNNVNPSQATLRSGQKVPTLGRRYQDAGKVYFESNAVIDVNRSMSFKMGDLYCVAPIVDPNCKKNCGYDFWAVGINCCAEDVADFRCGEYKNPAAKSGLRLMHDMQRPNFRLAVLEAEGVHKMVSTHPLFFYWLHDPSKEISHMKHKGFKGFVILMIGTFFFYAAMSYFALKFAREKFKYEPPIG